jgi:hypothetical protein
MCCFHLGRERTRTEQSEHDRSSSWQRQFTADGIEKKSKQKIWNKRTSRKPTNDARNNSAPAHVRCLRSRGTCFT